MRTAIFVLKTCAIVYALWTAINLSGVCNEFLNKTCKMPSLRSDFLTIVQSMWLIILSLSAVIFLSAWF